MNKLTSMPNRLKKLELRPTSAKRVLLGTIHVLAILILMDLIHVNLVEVYCGPPVEKRVKSVLFLHRF